MNFKVGFGYDIHRLAAGAELALGGIRIPSHVAAAGHSDADVILHAICDALLGALSLGDIGKHFPNTDHKYKGIDSKELLKHTFDLVKKQGYQIGNLDTTVCLETPKINIWVSEMQKVIAPILNTEVQNISIKATTAEKLGAIGKGEGIEASSIVLLVKNNTT